MLTFFCESVTLRVLIVDDHELTRLSLKLAFSNQENLQVVGLACNGQEAIEMLKSYQTDVIILDLQMPVMDGWRASSHIKAISPKTQILAYSSVEDASFFNAKTTANFDYVSPKDIPTNKLIALVTQLGERARNA